MPDRVIAIRAIGPEADGAGAEREAR